MSVTVSEFRDQIPVFEEIEQGVTLAVSGREPCSDEGWHRTE